MANLAKRLLLSGGLLSLMPVAQGAETIPMNATDKAALLDGRCCSDEWAAATKLALSDQALVYLMHDKDYFYICAQGKQGDITVLDLYIENAQTGYPHKFHLSAQMGESVRRENGWEPASDKWVLNGYAGFWVPYAGLKDAENRKDPRFADNTDRQVQVSRSKFPGNTWNMMFAVSARDPKGEWSEFVYPEKAQGEDVSTWARFSFQE
ncbi:hypothetical protein LJ739_17965 [Aestuariibacter halophilus]|uniref:Carbohydrate-binding domain-containing protein n=1 Tax=Fluctibacter halophilus TaxID=226011 RepID=A0ABS8GC87_9ALTE|nr:hypothetical protein [Aestuariibacter halophilus]MCC2618147.1 hypothetical protein [Aestuariibacter halophilus]